MISKLTTLPPPPQSGVDTDTEFETKANNLLTALPTFVTQTNEVIDGINTIIPYINIINTNINHIENVSTNMDNVVFFKDYYPQFDTTYKDFLIQKKDIDDTLASVQNDIEYYKRLSNAKTVSNKLETNNLLFDINILQTSAMNLQKIIEES